MIKTVSSANFAPKSYCSQNNISKSAINFGQSNDEFVSENKQEPEEKTFMQKHWGKILVATGLAVAGFFLLKKKPPKVIDDINPKVEEKASDVLSDAEIKPSEVAKIKSAEEKHLDELNAKIEKNPEDHTLLNERAHAHAKMNNTDDAIKDLSKAIELEPKNAEYYDGRALLYNMNHQCQEALADYTKLIELKPSAKTYINRGLTNKQLSFKDEAIADYTKAIELEPQNHSAFYNRAKVLVGMNKIEEAAKDASKALELKPKDNDYIKLGKYLDPKNPQPLLKRARFFAENKEPQKAIADFSAAIKLNDADFMPYFERGCLYEQTGKKKKAMADYTKTIELNPKNEYAYAKRSGLFSNLFIGINKNKKALNDINKAIELNPKEVDFYLDRMNLYGKMGKIEEADKDAATLYSFKAISEK